MLVQVRFQKHALFSDISFMQTAVHFNVNVNGKLNLMHSSLVLCTFHFIYLYKLIFPFICLRNRYLLVSLPAHKLYIHLYN